MSESSSHTIARERVDNLTVQNAEPDWLKAARLSAWEAYLTTPMPTGRDEDWRKTRVADLDLSKLIAVDCGEQGAKCSETSDKSSQGKGSSSAGQAQVALPGWFEEMLEHFPKRSHVVAELSQGSYDPQLPAELAKKGVVFCTLKKALKEHTDLVRPYLAETSEKGRDGKFELMVKALFNGGIFLYVPDNVEIKDPLFSLIDFQPSLNQLPSQGAAENCEPAAWAIFPRLVIVLGKNSRASLVNLFSSGANHKSTNLSLFNALVEVEIEDGGRLNYVEVENFAHDVFAVTKTATRVARDGQLVSLSVGIGGGQLKAEIDTELTGRGAASDVLGVVLGDREEHFSFNTIQGHHAPDTRSHINFRVALKDRAASMYQGTILVDKQAQKTDAFQSNKNLLLGADARADSIPKLEILADDVKCSHGATVGPVDREQVFYLMSRGLTASQSEELIVTGFFREVIEMMEIEGVKDWVAELVRQKVQSNS